MKKFILIASALTLLPLVAGAQGGITPIAPPSQINFFQVIDRVINWAFGLLLVLAVIMILVAAYLFLFAGANPDNQARAKNLIVYAVIAIVVAFAARGIVFLVRQLLQV